REEAEIGCEISNLSTETKKYGSFQYRQASRAGFERCLDFYWEFIGCSNFAEFETQTASVCGSLQLWQCNGRKGIARGYDHRDIPNTRGKFLQNLQQAQGLSAQGRRTNNSAPAP